MFHLLSWICHVTHLLKFITAFPILHQTSQLFFRIDFVKILLLIFAELFLKQPVVKLKIDVTEDIFEFPCCEYFVSFFLKNGHLLTHLVVIYRKNNRLDLVKYIFFD